MKCKISGKSFCLQHLTFMKKFYRILGRTVNSYRGSYNHQEKKKKERFYIITSFSLGYFYEVCSGHSPGLYVGFVVLHELMGKLRWLWQRGAEATIDGTSLLTRAWHRAGLEQTPTLSRTLPGVCARHSTDLSEQLDAGSAAPAL